VAVNLVGFEHGLQSFTQQIDKNAVAAVKFAGFTVLKEVVRHTPVDTGKLRASWNISKNNQDLGVSDYSAPKGTAKSVVKRTASAESLSGMQSISGLRLGDSIHVTNNIEYAPYIELGTEAIAPAGMLQRAIAFLKEKIS